MRLLIVPVLAASLLSGCAGGDLETPNTHTTVAVPGGMSLEQDNAYLERLREHGIESSNLDNLIGVGHAACTLLDMGETREDIRDEIRKRNPRADPDRTSAFIDAAEYAYCPQPSTRPSSD